FFALASGRVTSNMSISWKETWKNKSVIYWMRLSSALSWRHIQKISNLLAKLLLIFPNSFQRITVRNLSLCFPHLTADQQKKICAESLQHQVATLLELGPTWTQSLAVSQHAILQVRNENVLHTKLKEPNGLLLLLPHLGNWELANQYISQQTKVTALYKPGRLEDFSNWVVQSRERFGVRMVPTSVRGVAAAFKALKRGETVVILPDQEAPKANGIFAPFFNIPALTGTLCHRLIQKTNANVLCMFCRRDWDKAGFEMIFIEPDPQIYDEDMEIATTALNKSIENCIVLYPEQYQWSYKRFRRRPNKQPSLY
ncbi:MAG: lysophospholipid acyltransferase family protein, partial [Pseudomonadota bacterium]